MKRGNSCHRDMSGVMANARFGKLTINGRIIPEKCLKTNGELKKEWKSIYLEQTGYRYSA